MKLFWIMKFAIDVVFIDVVFHHTMVFMALVKLIFKWTNPGPRNIEFLYQWILKRLGRLRLGENPSPFDHKSSFKRYEISSVYRRAIDHSPPNRYLQSYHLKQGHIKPELLVQSRPKLYYLKQIKRLRKKITSQFPLAQSCSY
ncbi:hypothetical protein CUMW_215180 [Citrus unshiu]|uniref:Uncharacterized protein n=1 Tax=Citrus unshiu TaxID=55188 RepID=A0A2H5QCY9_CITUN|nr:hypothetical protein CUMW_215180 [Citrus unshiu]